MNLDLAVFPDRRVVYTAAQQMHHELRTIADSEDGNSKIKNILSIGRGGGIIYTVGATGKNDALGVHCPKLLQRSSV